MHHEFEHLLEAQWLGELSEKGRQRLEELCAADPALATRRRQELQLDALLGGYGPNHAPAGLAAAVFSRLEAKIKAPDPKRASILGAARKDAERAQRAWLRWQPFLRWGFAMLFLVVIGAEAAMFVQQEWHARRLRRNAMALRLNEGEAVGGPAAPYSLSPGMSMPAALAPPAESAPARARGARPVRPKPQTIATRKKSPHRAPASKMAAPLAVASPANAVFASIEPKLSQEQTKMAPMAVETASARAMLGAAPRAAPLEEHPFAPQAIVAAAIPAAPPAALSRELLAAAAPRPERAAKEIKLSATLRITLAPPASKVRVGPVAGAQRAERGAAARVNSAMRLGGYTGTPEIQSAALLGDLPTVKDVETAVRKAGGSIDSREHVAKGHWRLQCVLTPDGVRQFMRELEQSGVYPIATRPVLSTPETKRNALPRTVVPNRYEVTEGQGVLARITPGGAASAAPGDKVLLKLDIRQLPSPVPSR